jgi:nucleoside-diphosphate-sugar epimerase
MSILVIGAGQIGPHVATLLAERGEAVTVATRSGSGPEHPLVTRTRLDATDASALDRAFADVDVVHLCVHASAYRPDVWERELPPLERAVLAAAERHDVHVVYPESVYAFDTSGVLGAAPRIAPRSAMGPVRPLGRVDLPHAWTYLPDLAAAMVAAADATAGPDVVLAPVVHASQHELALAYARAAGRDDVRVRAVPAWALRAGGVVNADVRAMAEMSYLFTEPLLVDEGATIMPATPLDVAAAAVVDPASRSTVARP